MKIGTLRAIAHNVADSLGSGVGLLIGVYEMDVFGEAQKSPGGVIGIDFLAGKVTRGKVSPALSAAIAKYRKVLPDLCAKHGASIDDLKMLAASYSTDTINRRIIVRIRSHRSLLRGRIHRHACQAYQSYRSTWAYSNQTRQESEHQSRCAAFRLTRVTSAL